MTKRNGKPKFDKWIDVLALAVGVVALFFSWQANQIASRQVTDQVIPISSNYSWATYKQTTATYYDFSCVQRTRLSNLGGAGTSIVRYEATVYFKGVSTSVAGEQAYPMATAKLGDVLTGFRVEFVDKDTLEPNSKEPLFPVTVASFSTVDVWTRESFAITTTLTSGDFFYPPYDYYSFLQPGSKYGDLSPVEISFAFKTASGKTVAATPKALCIFLK